MLRIHFRFSPISAFGLSKSSNSSQSPFSIRFPSRNKKTHQLNSLLISCKSSSHSNFRGNGDHHDDEFLEAFILTAETVLHHHLRRQGFREETKWHSSGQMHPLSIQAKEPKVDVSSIGHAFLRRFQSPTVFLKIDCDGDLLLPIIVGEYAIEKLIEALMEDTNGESLNQFQFVKSLVGKLGYEVKMVRITKRVVNTYYARIYVGKPGEKATISVDARPSDAINVAEHCKVPIYVSKTIVSTDAIRLVYGKWRGSDSKPIYDVFLDSAAEGPDSLVEEFDLMRKMNMAITEERYKDAGSLKKIISTFFELCGETNLQSFARRDMNFSCFLKSN
ncbi:wound-responsive family protein isoform X2 [Tasmannia lanceolata]|uniref:wound-responsive family protein isoform X2 n=1 Tax=Tasmannia lanceolata TaxID=3420 RepID=UPI0040645E1C